MPGASWEIYAMASDAYYPPVGFHFRVEFQDIPGLPQRDTFFREVGGLSQELNTDTVNSGGENRFSYKLPTRGQYPNLTLKRGLFKDSGLISWVTDAIVNLDIKPATILVSLLNEQHTPLITYKCVNAYPQKWSVSDFNAEESQLVVENLELIYQYFTIIK
jgi:phage tail-like protein